MRRPFLSFIDFVGGLGSWKQPLTEYVASKNFQNIYKYVKTEYESGKKVKIAFCSATHRQDPYHQPGQAHGLCFSVLKPIPPPPSLKNIYKNLMNDKNVDFMMPNHGDLTHWAEQGVLLLNSSLTVEDSKPNSHAKCGWQDFTSEIINIVHNRCDKVVFMLWGKPAQEKAKSVNAEKHCILKTSHPSPLSFKNGFEKSTNFSDCNAYLINTNRKPIDWNVK